ncbi:MAG: hypothetical protein ACLR0V_07985 [Roseburia hominis]
MINEKSNPPSYAGENGIVGNGEDKKKKNLLWYIENGVASQTQHRSWSKWTIKAYHTLDGNANITSFSFPNIGKRYCMGR